MIDPKHFSVLSLRRFLVSLSRAKKSWIAVGVDFGGFSLCAFLTIWVLFVNQISVPQTLFLVLTTAIISIGVAWWRGLYRSIVRYMGVDLLATAGGIALGAAIVGTGLIYITDLAGSPTRWTMAYFAFSLIYVGGSRYFARQFLITRRARNERERVIIYGAGEAGVLLTNSLRSSDNFFPVAMVDDDESLHGKRVIGLEVFPPSMIEVAIRDTGVKRVLLAMPSASRRRRRQILDRLSECPVHVQTIPVVNDIVSGKARLDDISDVDVEDLLGRDPIPPNPQLLGASIAGKSVMVTGAGGSIGSELCRQILLLNPQRLVLLELNEASLYRVDKEMIEMRDRLQNDAEIVALLGSVHHENRVGEAMRTFGIQTVYHAAAYKHVPIVEGNLIEGICNNVFGTLHAARAAIANDIETFVLLSTDKAVNPSSVMGATKRLAELVLQALNTRSSETRFCMVRFGNVLASSGSVVPLFREQIRNGGPVTVTHRDIIRYFMTIPEAAQLVLQAGGMAKGGDVFVLDMGAPVKIFDLAHRMIKLMGLTVRDMSNLDGDIEIEYIGLRPAEKLYEELLIGSNVSGTEHPRIMQADENFLSFDRLLVLLGELKTAVDRLDYHQARDILIKSVREYSPENGIDDLIWLRKADASGKPDLSSVIDFPARPI